MYNDVNVSCTLSLGAWKVRLNINFNVFNYFFDNYFDYTAYQTL